MAFSFSADAVQYSRDNAYYAREVTSGAGTVLPGPVEVRGALVVDGTSTLEGAVTVEGSLTSNTLVTSDVTVNPSPTTSVNLGLAGGFPSIAFVNGAGQTLIGLQSPTGPLLLGNNSIDVGVPHDLRVGETIEVVRSILVGSSTNVGGAISGFNGTSLVAPNFPQGLASAGGASVASLDGTWAGTTIPTLPFGAIPINTTAQAGNIKLGNTRFQWGVANVTFTTGSGAITVPFTSAFSTANFVTFLTGAFGNAGNIPVTLQASPSGVSAFTVNAGLGAVGDSGNYEFQWIVIGPSTV